MGIRRLIVRCPKICLCGSTRFLGDFIAWNAILTLQGAIVHSISNVLADKDGANSLIGANLDFLHKQKISLSDAILVLDLNGYIGDSTRSEIAHAEQNDVEVVYLSTLEPSAQPIDLKEALEKAYGITFGITLEQKR